jgi:UDP:flavonoid glycosyltransferase YjiC (YdhE family)
MRVLLTSWAWPTHYFPMVPLGWALRAAGHEVRVASQPALADAITQSGLPAVVVGHDVDVAGIFDRMSSKSHTSAGAGRGGADRHDKPPWENRDRLSPEQQREWSLRGLGMFVAPAEAMIDDLLDFARHWRPDLVVYEPTSFAGPLAAARLGIPGVRHLWGMDYTLESTGLHAVALAPVMDRLGLAEIASVGAVTVDNCPGSLQVPGDHPRLPVRFVPYNGPGTAPGWLLDPPARPRVCVTLGTTNSRLMPNLVQTRPVLEALSRAGLEVVAALSTRDAARLGPPPAGVRVAQSLPLHLLLPSCDLILHQGGMGTSMTALAHGVPQLIMPVLPDQTWGARHFVAAGVATQVPLWEASEKVLTDRASQMVGTPGYRAAAAALQAEIAAQPPPSAVVARLERLAGAQREPAPVS